MSTITDVIRIRKITVTYRLTKIYTNRESYSLFRGHAHFACCIHYLISVQKTVKTGLEMLRERYNLLTFIYHSHLFILLLAWLDLIYTGISYLPLLLPLS